MNVSNMDDDIPDCIILAGGLGSRLREVLSEGIPKILAPVAQKPFLWWLVYQLYRQGIRRVVLALGYGAARVQESLATEVWPRELAIQSVVEPSTLGTGGALRFALDATHSDPVLLVNGDTLTDVDFHKLVTCHRRNNASVTIALTNVPDARRYGSVAYRPDGLVTGFAEKAKEEEAPGDINAGVYCLSRRWVASIPVGKPVSLERELLPSLIGQGLFAYLAAHRFIDIGTPLSLGKAEEFVRQCVETHHDH